MRLASHEVTIAAPAEVVWAHLTTAEGLVRWVGPEAIADPTPDGVLRWVHPNGATVVGRFVELVPHRRLVFTYGWEDGRLGVPPGSTTSRSTWSRRPAPPPSAWSTMACPPRPCSTTSGDGPTSSASCATPCRPCRVPPDLATRPAAMMTETEETGT
jgi:uncharacterized protein YndB with AHSA1/START domain